jgi:enoyl-CoA hydratase/carnithine racemase
VETLLVERQDGVVTLTLNRPEKRNAANQQMWRELDEVFAEVGERKDDRVLVITGAGDGFCSGADLSDRASASERSAGPGAGLARVRRIGQVALSLHQLPKPTIAAVNGVAAGAGCNLALGCDLIVASERARFSEIFVQRGLTLDFGGAWLLPRLIGLHRAKELAFFGEIISAEQAASIGLVNRVVPAETLRQTVVELAARLAALPPLSLSLIKMALNRSLSLSMAETLELEALAQATAYGTQDMQEAMRAFAEKRPANFTGQ